MYLHRTIGHVLRGFVTLRLMSVLNVLYYILNFVSWTQTDVGTVESRGDPVKQSSDQIAFVGNHLPK